MRENVDQNNSEYGHFSRSDTYFVKGGMMPLLKLNGLGEKSRMSIILCNFVYILCKRGANKVYIKKFLGEAKHLLQDKESIDKFDINSLKVTLGELCY